MFGVAVILAWQSGRGLQEGSVLGFNLDAAWIGQRPESPIPHAQCTADLSYRLVCSVQVVHCYRLMTTVHPNGNASYAALYNSVAILNSQLEEPFANEETAEFLSRVRRDVLRAKGCVTYARDFTSRNHG